MGNLKISSGGKFKISSGKMSVKDTTPSILVDLSIEHIAANAGVAHYALGLAANVTYASNYFHRFTVTASGAETIQVDEGNISVPNAVANDGITDFWIYFDVGASGGGYATAALGGMPEGDLESYTINDTNGRYPMKLAAGNGATIEFQIDWEN